jgi:hypothetical protein
MAVKGAAQPVGGSAVGQGIAEGVLAAGVLLASPPTLRLDLELVPLKGDNEQSVSNMGSGFALNSAQAATWVHVCTIVVLKRRR